MVQLVSRTMPNKISAQSLTFLFRNDVAIQKAQDLGTKHNIKTAAYKVDGMSLATC